MVGIGKSHPRKTTKCENVADALQLFILDSFVDQDFQLGFRKVNFIFVSFLFHPEIPKRVFIDPFVADAVENEILNTAQQVDRSVRFAEVCCLQKSVEAIDIGIVQGREQNIVLFVLCHRIFFQVAQYPVILVCRQLGDVCRPRPAAVRNTLTVRQGTSSISFPGFEVVS